MSRNRISRPHAPGQLPEYVYRPQHTDDKKFSEGFSRAFGKGENVLVECAQCGHRHWTHQSCINNTPQ